MTDLTPTFTTEILEGHKFDPRHCELCGFRIERTDEGYTLCCNELECHSFECLAVKVTRTQWNPYTKTMDDHVTFEHFGSRSEYDES